jgi:uncharacterized membrane protein YccC
VAFRLTIACTLAVALVMALHVPEGEFTLVSLFVVSLGNSGASLERGGQRVLATLVGGALAIAALVLSADKPWLLFPIHAVVSVSRSSSPVPARCPTPSCSSR